MREDTVTVVDGWLRGPVRAPANRGRASASDDRTPPPRGSIHDDATAQKLGFKGGTIAGSVHMDQFPPVLLAAFGERWFETGSLSLTFRHATTSGEPVLALVEPPPPDADDVQVRVRMEQPDRTLVAEGTASVGVPAGSTHLGSADLRPGDPERLRILAGVRPGDAIPTRTTTLDGKGVAARVAAGGLTEPLPWYTEPSPWGGPIANPSSMVQLLRNRPNDFGPHVATAVGLFGAIEIRHHAGPVRFGAPYTVSGRVVAVGSSPRTEYVWYDTSAEDEAGTVVASMRMQLRWMTASSPLYADEAKTS